MYGLVFKNIGLRVKGLNPKGYGMLRLRRRESASSSEK